MADEYASLFIELVFQQTNALGPGEHKYEVYMLDTLANVIEQKTSETAYLDYSEVEEDSLNTLARTVDRVHIW